MRYSLRSPIIAAALLIVTISALACGETRLLGPDVVVYSRLSAGAFSTNVPDGLELRLQYPTPIRDGEAAEMHLALTNVSGQPIDIIHGSPAFHDFVVTTADSTVVWEYLRSLGANLNDAASTTTLQPGEALESSVTWNGADLRTGNGVAKGTYLVRGVFFGNKCDGPDHCFDGYLWTAPAALVIE
jgi:hypothetical protein